MNGAPGTDPSGVGLFGGVVPASKTSILSDNDGRMRRHGTQHTLAGSVCGRLQCARFGRFRSIRQPRSSSGRARRKNARHGALDLGNRSGRRAHPARLLILRCLFGGRRRGEQFAGQVPARTSAFILIKSARCKPEKKLRTVSGQLRGPALRQPRSSSGRTGRRRRSAHLHRPHRHPALPVQRNVV